MAGLDLFGNSMERTPKLRKKSEPRIVVPKSELDNLLEDEKLVEKLKELAPATGKLDTALVLQIEELTKKKKAIELAFNMVKKELETARNQMLYQMLNAGTKSYKSERGVGFSRVQRIHYSMESPKDKVEFVKSIGRDDVLEVPAPEFNSLCASLIKEGKTLPLTIKKSETHTLTVRGV